MKGGVGFPSQNQCVETNVRAGGVVVKKSGRFIESAMGFPAGLLVGNTIYTVIDPADYVSVNVNCGPPYDQRRLYRDQRYGAVPDVGGRKSRRSYNRRTKKTLKKKQVSKRK